MDDKMAFLTNSILKSKDVMRAVENKTYRGGSIDPSKIIASDNLVESNQMAQPFLSTPPAQSMTAPTFNARNLETSKMPKEILESFRKNPPQAAQNGIGLSFLDDIAGNIPKPQPTQPIQQPVQPTQQWQQPTYTQPVNTGGMNELQLEGLKSILEKLVRETMEKVFDEREKLTESKEISENIQLKIGDSIFSGKITGVKSIKK